MIVYIACTRDCSDDKIDIFHPEKLKDCWGWFYYINYACDKFGSLGFECKDNSSPMLITFGIINLFTFVGAAVLAYLSRNKPAFTLYAMIATGAAYLLFIIGFSVITSQISKSFFEFEILYDRLLEG